MVVALEERDFGLYQPKTELVTLLSVVIDSRNTMIQQDLDLFIDITRSLYIIQYFYASW